MRIIVKNLPHFITENEIKDHFKSQGEITDCFIPKDQNGKSRRICFIGYKDEKSCIRAIEKLNGIYLHNHKINVSLCKNNKDKLITESEERITLYYSKLFVMYLPKVDLKILREELEKFGEIKSCSFLEQPSHFNCELIYKNPEDSLNFLKNVNEILGKIILIKPNKDHNNQKQIEYYNSLFFNFESIVKRVCIIYIKRLFFFSGFG
ncbi:polyadenylate binding protein 2 [Nosema bombycis CQ1]|uniref:Polyadenylate binding protein 2 n=1 Tax=Nosema bombycis (strain CQ1 / CVCC 102059) TaxID=578461 RepID=R0KL12_NOSB1|nr:polyadenylate binding protein 2 [Nosema bombycis CQ1]|eukprot:EOB11311.1 polyadenylate binding protein 2 [Nosema bombycis CQ1]